MQETLNEFMNMQNDKNMHINENDTHSVHSVQG